jgi:hypothetical protein
MRAKLAIFKLPCLYTSLRFISCSLPEMRSICSPHHNSEDPWSTQAGPRFAVGKVPRGQVFLPALPVPTVSVIPPTLRTRSFVYHRHCVTLATGSVSNTRHKVMFNVTAQPWTCVYLVVISCLISDSFRNANIQFGPHREHSASVPIIKTDQSHLLSKRSVCS